VAELGVLELAAAYRDARLTPADVTESCIEAIEKIDQQVGAFTYLDRTGARGAADQLTRELQAGRARGPLHGIPIAIKELFDVAGAPSEAGSLARRGEVAERDSLVVARLRAAGAIIIGLTRTHEFAWGITTQHLRRGSTRNPWNLGRIPGGSSGGSAAAVAAGLVPVAIGTDTGGSIRIPSALCGVAGIKPTFGRVSRVGLAPLASSLDTVGVIGRRVRDLFPVLEVISQPAVVELGRPLSELVAPGRLADLAGLRLGVVPSAAAGTISARRRFEDLLTRATDLGAVIVELSLPGAEEFRAVFTTIQAAEAFDVHARILRLYPRQAADYGEDVRGRLAGAEGVGIGEYLAAKREQARLTATLDAALEEVDALLAPIAPVPAPSIGDPDITDVDGIRMPFRDAVMGLQVPYNIAGGPSVAFRAGFDEDSMPWGAQVVTARGQEARALAVAEILERTSDDPDR
jgi:aspartyl-tRNA(Asn)/glutamyl-tRNA(Gln) amidotransferase subunit A